MSGWGGVVAQGLAGFASGVGKGGLDDIVERQKIEAQKLRDAELARLSQETHTANARSDLRLKDENFPTALRQAVDTQEALLPGEVKKAKELRDLIPLNVTEGSTLVDNEGNIIFQAPKRELSDEQKEYYIQRAEEARARTALVTKKTESTGTAKPEKVGSGDIPKWTMDPENKKLFIDTNSGWTREKVEGVPGRDAKPGILGTNFLSKNAVPGTPDTYIYRNEEGEIATAREYFAQYPKSKGAQNLSDVVVPGREASGKISGQSSAPPLGWVAIGRTPDGRMVYRTPDGKQKAL